MRRVSFFFAAVGLALVLTQNTSAQQLGTYTFVPLAGNPHDVVYDSTRNLAYVSNRSLNRIDVVSLATNTVQTSIPVGVMPMGLAITPDYTQLLVTLYTPRQMAVVDLNTQTKIRSFNLPTAFTSVNPLRVDFDSSGTCFWRDGGPGGAFGPVYILDQITGVSTRLFPDESIFRYSYNWNKSKFMFMFNSHKVSIWNAATQSSSVPQNMPDFGSDWWNWLTQGAINNAGNKILLNKGGSETRVYDQNLTYLGSTTQMAWGTFGPWNDVAVIVEGTSGEGASGNISLISAGSLSKLQTLTLPESIGVNEYNYGSNPITLTDDATKLLAVGQTRLFIINIDYPVFESLEILGPDQVAENSTIQYKAIAHYDNGATRDVTASAAWSVVPNDHASINSAGNLTVNDLEKFQNVVIAAQYTYGGVTVDADKGVTLYAVCPFGTGLKFDGQDDYVDLPDGFADFTNGLTIMLWAYPSNNAFWARFIEFGNGSNHDNILFARGETSNDLYFEVYQTSSGGRVFIPSALVLNVWQHFAVTLNNKGEVIIYKNGQPLAKGTTAIPRNVLRTMNYIGKSNWSVDGYYGGMMDEIRVYNRVLSSQEIQSGMHMPPNIEPSLISYWNFNEGSGQVVQDISSYGNNAQLGSTAGADASDPVWVASDAPVGVCTPYIIAVQNIKTALAKKLQMLDTLESTLENEQNAIDALRDMIADGDLGDLKKTDVLKSIADIRLAMVQQTVSRLALRRSVIRLEEALSRLGVDVPPHQWPDKPDESQTHNPADMNMDGQVNLLDLSLFIDNWNP